jgi:membrane protease YdiL (CAAX protease family)
MEIERAPTVEIRDEKGDREKMLKMREPIEQQQMGEPTELPTQQRQSLGRRILMFPLSRLLIAGTVFALVAGTVVSIAAFVAGYVVGLLHPVDSSVGSVLSLSGNGSEVMEMVLIFGLLAVAGTITLALMGKVIERRSLAEVGLGRQGLLRHTLRGFGIGTGMVLLLVLMEKAAVLLGLIGPEGEEVLTIDYLNLVLEQVQEFGGVVGYLGLAFAFACFVAVAEEIVFRGLLFRILEEGLGSWLAMAISALLFGAYHLGNFEDPTLLSVASQTAGGFALAAAYMLTRKVWLPIGLHWGWDFAIFAISPEALLTIDEASAEAVPALTALIISIPDLVLAIVLLALVIRRGQIRTPRWMRRKRTHKKPYVDENATPLTEEKAVDELVAL